MTSSIILGYGIRKTSNFIFSFHPSKFKSVSAIIGECRKYSELQTCDANKPIHGDAVLTLQENKLATQDDEINHPFSMKIEKQYLDDIGVKLRPSFNLAAYANHSLVLQKLVDLGVDISKIEEKIDASFLLKLDFKKDVQKHILFLHRNCDIPMKELGPVFTKVPQVLQEDIDDLKIRISYLKSRKFTREEITRLIIQVPSFLLLDTLKLDQRFGFLQNFFSLKGSQVRKVTVQLPKLILCNLQSIRENDFSIKEEMGFSEKERKELFLSAPKLWLKQREKLVERFDFVHNSMAIPHEQILSFPRVLFSRTFILQQRHKYLALLGRAQYNPKKPCYVSLKSLVSGSDAEFCRTVAGTGVEDFNKFLKTL